MNLDYSRPSLTITPIFSSHVAETGNTCQDSHMHRTHTCPTTLGPNVTVQVEPVDLSIRYSYKIVHKNVTSTLGQDPVSICPPSKDL